MSDRKVKKAVPSALAVPYPPPEAFDVVQKVDVRVEEMQYCQERTLVVQQRCSRQKQQPWDCCSEPRKNGVAVPGVTTSARQGSKMMGFVDHDEAGFLRAGELAKSIPGALQR